MKILPTSKNICYLIFLMIVSEISENISLMVFIYFTSCRRASSACLAAAWSCLVESNGVHGLKRNKGLLGLDVFLTCLLDTSTINITTLYQHLLCLEHLTSEVAN